LSSRLAELSRALGDLAGPGPGGSAAAIVEPHWDLWFDGDEVQTQAPETIAGYQVERRLSTGGMGTVFLAARHGSHGFEKRVAIKLLNPEFFNRADIKQLFIDEARLAARLSHPNIEEERYYLVMEYIEGARLLDVQRAQRQLDRPLPAPLAARVIADAARALHYAHELRSENGQPLGVVHRDVSPENIIVTETGHTKVLDFGIARWADRISVTHHNVVRGKAAYMSPEQVRGRPLDRRSDVFALGIVLHELLTCRPLFPRGSLVKMMEAVEQAPIPDPRELVPELSAGLAQLLARALDRDLASRLETAEQMAFGLEEALRDSGGLATTEALAQHLRSHVGLQPTDRAVPLAIDSSAATVSSQELDPGRPPARQTEVLGSPGPTDPAAAVTTASATGIDDEDTGRARGVSTAPMAKPLGDDAVPGELDLDAATTELTPAMPPRRSWTAALALGVVTALAALLLWALAGGGNEITPAPAPLTPVVGLSGDSGAPVAPQPTADAAVASAVRADAAPAAPRPRRDAARRPRSPRNRDAAEVGAPVPPSGTGKVSVFSKPWGNVRVDGQLLGPTPLIDHELPAGPHLIEVVAPDTNSVIHSERIDLEPAERAKVEARAE